MVDIGSIFGRFGADLGSTGGSGVVLGSTGGRFGVVLGPNFRATSGASSPAHLKLTGDQRIHGANLGLKLTSGRKRLKSGQVCSTLVEIAPDVSLTFVEVVPELATLAQCAPNWGNVGASVPRPAWRRPCFE